MIRPLSDFCSWGYQHLAKPVLFQIPPDHIHENTLKLSAFANTIPLVPQLIEASWAYHDPRLTQTLGPTTFANPIGLSAGYDYLGVLPTFLPRLGFGWGSIGSITNEPYAGNTPPMYGRLPETQSLWVNKGFKNPGAQAIRTKLEQLPVNFSFPSGLSIGATNKPYHTFEEVLHEYDAAFQTLRGIAGIQYYELNISCPNLQSPFSLYEPRYLKRLLQLIDGWELDHPLYVKMPVDLELHHFDELLQLISFSPATGVIIGNLTKERAAPTFWRSEVHNFPEYGGFSGKPVQAKADPLIAYAFQNYGKRLVIIGTGGVFSAQDAYQKIQLGAQLVQLITGMIYQGPQVVGQINQDLVRLLERDGFHHISEAVGTRLHV